MKSKRIYGPILFVSEDIWNKLNEQRNENQYEWKWRKKERKKEVKFIKTCEIFENKQGGLKKLLEDFWNFKQVFVIYHFLFLK
jgi:hypothetical protein